jgi:hypothetical protein
MGEGVKQLLKRIDECHNNLSQPIGGKTISRAILSWYVGEPFEAGSVATDGMGLYSYNLCIGVTKEDGAKSVLNYTARTLNGKPSRGYQSQTTSMHVGRAFAILDELSHVFDEIMEADANTAYEDGECSEGVP